MKLDQYLDIKTTMKRFDRGRTWANNLFRKVEQSGRYEKQILHYKGIWMIHEDAVIDYMMNAKSLERGEVIAPYERREKNDYLQS